MRGRGEGSIRQRRKADGTVYWEARVSIHGRQVSFYAPSKTEAQAQARQARADAERGRATPRANLTVEGWLRHWLAHVEGTVRARTLKRYREICEVHIIPALGSVTLHQLNPAQVERMLARMLDRGSSATTVGHARAVLSNALHQAQRDMGLGRNAAALAKLPRTNEPSFKPETVTPEQARAILAAFEGSKLEPLVLFSVATGVRQGELLALRWQDVDERNRSVTIRHAVDVRDGKRVLARPKSERAHRTIRLPALALEALQMRREQEPDERLLAGRAWQDLDLVFPGAAGAIRNWQAVTRNFKARLERHGIEPIRWHALRRVFAALLQDAGVPLERVRDLMGHSELQVTESYAYTLHDSLLRDMDAIDEALSAESRRGPRKGAPKVDSGAN